MYIQSAKFKYSVKSGNHLIKVSLFHAALYFIQNVLRKKNIIPIGSCAISDVLVKDFQSNNGRTIQRLEKLNLLLKKKNARD